MLHGVDLDLRAGEIHAIVGENGAGKSTLMKVLAGVHPPDDGTIRIDGEEVSFHHPHAAQAAGVGIVYQEFNLLPDRTVAENVFVGREPAARGIVDRRGMERETAALLEEVGEASFGPRTLVRRLSVAQQQVVEIVKARSLDARILVLDEPTAALADHEVELLFALVRRLQERGIGMLYISHRLREVFALADRITVLKDGGAGQDAGHVRDRLARAREPDGRPRARRLLPAARRARRPRRRAAARGRACRPTCCATSASQVRAGEIVGLAGLQGSGRTELARAIFGADPVTAGTIEIDGKPRRFRTPRAAVRAGLGFITEDRKLEGLALAQSIADNMLLAVRTVIPGARRRRNTPGLMSVKELAAVTELRARGPEQEVRFLSGGNQQKVVLAKWLETRPQILIFDEPTRGIDVGAKAGIHDLIRKLAKEGVAVLMISSELPELIGMSDRILVMHEGTLAGELPGGAGEAEIMHLATGHQEAAA